MMTQQNTITPVKVTNILIDGATGYIGSHLVVALRCLNNSQLAVNCLIREGSSKKNIDFLNSTGAKIWQGDLQTKNNNIADAFKGVDVACHLIGSIAPKRGESSHSIHVQQTERFIDLCLKAHVKKIIMVSACGTRAQSNIAYQRTKWQAEQLVKNSGVPAIILRPSLIIGKTAGQRNSKLITRLQDLIVHKKAVPLVGGGYNKVQPVFIDDLTQAIVAAMLEVPAGMGDNVPVFELGGPEVLTLRELTERLMQVLGRQRPIFDLLPYLATVLAFLSETMQAVPILSRDQVKLSLQDNICSQNAIAMLIKKQPINVENALKSYTLADGV